MFNLNWFKSKKKEEELLDLQIRREKLITDSLEMDIQEQKGRRIVEEVPSQWQPLPQKPYKKVKFVNNVLTVIFNDGSVINKSQATVQDFNDVRNASTESQIIDVIKTADIVKNEPEKAQEPSGDAIHIVSHFPDFEVKEECIYMNGIDRSVPPLLIKRFGEILSKYDKNKAGWENDVVNDIEYSSLKKFWLKACLNPNAQSAEDLYTFLSHHNMKIDRHGNFFAYRRVVKIKTSEDSALINLISTAYNNVKAVWKKKASDYRIEKNAGYSFHKITSEPKGEIVGNLDTLYRNLPSMQGNRYTDAHTHSMDYRVGSIMSMPRNEGDDNNQVSCSFGYHQASKKYNYSGFGDTPILSIVNPMDVLAVPVGEVGKLRVSRWFFAMTLEEQDKYILDDDDFDVTELGDIFEEKCLQNIEEHVHQSFAEEVKCHTFTIPQMSNVNIKNISIMLKDMNEIIKNRIVKK